MNRELSATQAFDGMQACIRNAEALIEEAKILADAKHPVRAIALAVLAYEELGKLSSFGSVDIYSQQGRMDEWWRTFRSHGRKIAMQNMMALAVTVDQVDQELIEETITGAAAKALYQLKMVALYTDFQEGSFVCPLDMPSAAELAESTITIAEFSLGLHRGIVGALSAESLQSYWERGSERSAKIEEDVEHLDSQLKSRLGEERYDALLLKLQRIQEATVKKVRGSLR